MQKRTEATRDSASLLHKAIACIVSVMLAMGYSSIAYAFDGEVSDTTVTTEDASASVAAADEPAESVGATATEEINEATSADAEADGAASFDAESDGVDAFALLLSTSGRLAAISAGAEKAAFASTQTNAIQTLAHTNNHFTISGGIEETDWTFNDNVIAINTAGTYTITGDGEDHSGYQITVAGGITVELTLNNVKITSSSGAAMDITNTANVTLYLEGENSFASASYYAGIQFANASEGASLTITSTANGSLSAQGGARGAGIGGGNGAAGNYITISGGTVTATGGGNDRGGAGIGGGYDASASNITITGGTVTATGGVRAAGIGGGYAGSASNITISGGTVTAQGNYGGAGIGGGFYGSASNITISGGTVTATGGGYGAAGIGNGYNSSTNSSNITISGGSVKASSISVTPTNGDESNPQNVYLCKIENLSGVNEVTIDNTIYTRDGNHPDDDGTFYLYLTGENHEITANGIDYRAVWDGDASSVALKTYVAAPTATFTAADDSSGTLSNVDTSMKYSVDGGDTWHEITGSSMDIIGVTAEDDILIYKETDTEVSYTQKIDVTQAAQPTAVSGADCTTSEQNDGQITGLDSSMEYRLSTDFVWTDITGNRATGLAPGTYYVRVKASGTQLASTAATVTVASHTCAGQGDWLSDENNHWKLCSCGEKADEGPHSGGAATCEGQAACAGCGQPYGEVLGHDWEGPVWSWASGYSSATATFTCKNDASHTQTLAAEVSEARTEPTETDEGSVVYTATVEWGENTYTETQTLAIPATGTTEGSDPSDDGSEGGEDDPESDGSGDSDGDGDGSDDGFEGDTGSSEGEGDSSSDDTGSGSGPNTETTTSSDSSDAEATTGSGSSTGATLAQTGDGAPALLFLAAAIALGALAAMAASSFALKKRWGFTQAARSGRRGCGCSRCRTCSAGRMTGRSASGGGGRVRK